MPRPVEYAPPADPGSSGPARQGAAPSYVPAAIPQAAEAVDAAVEADLTRTDDIGSLFGAYGYAPPPMPDFGGGA